MTIREKIDYLTALEQTIEFVNEHIANAMGFKIDENTGEYMCDENGDYIRIAPQKDDYSYREYIGFTALKAQIEKLSDKI